MALTSDYLFFSAKHPTLETRQLIAFNFGETSQHQLNHFTASVIDTYGHLIPISAGLHAFAWDLSPSNPNTKRLWQALFQSKISKKYNASENFVSFQGFNPEELSLHS
jgi:hypothetical protein